MRNLWGLLIKIKIKFNDSKKCAIFYIVDSACTEMLSGEPGLEDVGQRS